jgi:hypothetical protein
MTKAIVVVADTHVGSIFGMLPPNFKTSGDIIQPLNEGQKFLWECWLQFVKWVGESVKPVAVVLNGDIMDGSQDKQKGCELAIPLHRDQVPAAVEVLKPLKDVTGDAAWLLVQGTPYHGGVAGGTDDSLAEALGCIPYPGYGTGRFSREALDLDIDGVQLNFAHGISTTTGLYRATAIDRETLWAALAGKEGKALKSDCIVRSHMHCYLQVEHPTKHGVITPCWQLQTRHMRKNSLYRFIPDIGGIILWFDPDLKKNGEDPIRISKKLYPLPKPKATKLVLPT